MEDGTCSIAPLAKNGTLLPVCSAPLWNPALRRRPSRLAPFMPAALCNAVLSLSLVCSKAMARLASAIALSLIPMELKIARGMGLALVIGSIFSQGKDHG